MAESSIFWGSSGTGDGAGTGYTQTQMFQLMRSLARTGNLGGVFPDVLNELAVTGTVTPVSINTGQAICYGVPYFNTAAVTVAIPTPASLTRVDYIVLRASWAAQTVRITRIAGTEGAGAPALVQTPNTTYDIPLATVSITTGSMITVTDAREWATGVGDATIDSTKLAANAVGTSAIANDAITNAKLANMTNATVKGRTTAGTGDPEDLTKAQALTLLNVADGADVTATALAAAAAKVTPVAADTFPLSDSAAGNALKKVTYSNLLAAIGISSGTFTPTILIAGVGTGITYNYQTGYYFKMGTYVSFIIQILLLNKGAVSGDVTIGGLPFPAANLAGGFFRPISFSGFSNLATPAIDVSFEVFGGGNVLQGRIHTAASIGNADPIGSADYLKNTHITNSTGFVLSGSYIST